MIQPFNITGRTQTLAQIKGNRFRNKSEKGLKKVKLDKF